MASRNVTFCGAAYVYSPATVYTFYAISMMGQNNMAKSIVNFILFIIFIDIKFVKVSILIVSRCKYKDYFRFYKVYFHIFIVAVRGWLIHTQHETQALYTNVRTRTYAHATRQLFDHRPPITHNNLPYSILQRWSKNIQMSDRPPIDHPSISMAAYTVSPSTPFFIT